MLLSVGLALANPNGTLVTVRFRNLNPTDKSNLSVARTVRLTRYLTGVGTAIYAAAQGCKRDLGCRRAAASKSGPRVCKFTPHCTSANLRNRSCQFLCSDGTGFAP